MVSLYDLTVWQRRLRNEDFARNLPAWRQSGFRIDYGVRILAESYDASLTECIASPPISLIKIRLEPFNGRVLFHAVYSEYFKHNVHAFDALVFLA